MNRILIAVALVLAGACSNVAAGTILDLIKPHEGKEILLAAGRQTTKPTLTVVADGYFCVRPQVGGDQCFPVHVIERVIIRAISGPPITIGLLVDPQLGLPGDSP